MFCQCIFNKEGKIIDKTGAVEGMEIQSKTISELFIEVGLEEKEWKIGEEYIANYNDKKFKCIATKLGGNFQFIGIDVTQIEQLKEQYESQNRISDLNLNRLLNTLEEQRDSKQKIQSELEDKNSLISTTNHRMRESLNAIIGLVEIIQDTEPSAQKEFLTLLNTSSQELLKLVDTFEVK